MATGTFLSRQPIFIFVVPDLRTQGQTHSRTMDHTQRLLVILARKLRIIPKSIWILCTSHGSDLFSLQGGLLQSLKRFTFRNTDHATVMSNVMHGHLITMGCDTGNISIQSMGVDQTRQFTPDRHTVKIRDIAEIALNPDTTSEYALFSIEIQR